MSLSKPLDPPRFDLFLAELARAIEKSRGNNSLFALVLIDLAHFTRFNALYGYHSGNLLLTKVQERLVGICRPQDQLQRIDGDVFAMLLPQLMGEGHAVLAATKILRTLESPYLFFGSTIRLNAAIGIAFSPNDANDAEELLKRAEIALHSAKHSEQEYQLYSEMSRGEEPLSSWEIEAALEMAIENQEFELHYQPQVMLTSRKVHGAEALIRWNRPEQGMIPPDHFIPVAEGNKELIRELTLWCLNTALQQIADWVRQGLEYTLSVNISASLIHDVELIELVRSGLRIWSIPPHLLTLEVTESALLEDPVASFAILKGLRTLGVKISIDDFGTGHSSLSYFRNIPATELKIDKSFIVNLLESTADRHIVHTIIELAHGFDILVVAEGVEDDVTLAELSQLGCDVIQGYIFGRAMPSEAFTDWAESFEKGDETPSPGEEKDDG